jgi:hypothetical protein
VAPAPPETTRAFLQIEKSPYDNENSNRGLESSLDVNFISLSGILLPGRPYWILDSVPTTLNFGIINTKSATCCCLEQDGTYCKGNVRFEGGQYIWTRFSEDIKVSICSRHAKMVVKSRQNKIEQTYPNFILK